MLRGASLLHGADRCCTEQVAAVGSCSAGTVRANAIVVHTYRKKQGLLRNQQCCCYRPAQVVDVCTEAASGISEVR